MTQYYECHITMTGDKETVERHTDAVGWKFSAIDGDPSLGEGIKCYATTHYNSRIPMMEVIDSLQSAANNLRTRGVTVIREKVELVIFDTKSASVRPQ